MALNKIRALLNDNTYNINLSPNKIYINNYNDILEIKDHLISINFQDFYLNINGYNFKIQEMVDNEILLNGSIESMEYIYKK